MGRIAAGLLAALLWVAGTVHDAAAQGQPQYPLTRIAFGSCANEELRQPNWGAVLAYGPDLFLFTGTMSMET